MPDMIVMPRHILAAVNQLRRLGPRRALEQLESAEPDLAEHVLEQLAQVHRAMMNLGAAAKPTQRAFVDVQAVVLVAIASLQGAYREREGGPDHSGRGGE